MYKCKYKLNHPVFRNVFMGRKRNKYVLPNENSNQDPLRRTIFSQYSISYRGPFRKLISENLALSDSNSHQGNKY